MKITTPPRVLLGVAAVAVLAFFAAAVAARSANAPRRAQAAGACIPAPVEHGPPPKWTAAAWADSSKGFTLPYALATRTAAAAFFWVPLHAGAPTNPANKVLWIVRFPRNGSPLRITARSNTSPARTVRMSFPDNASPGEIYPSYVNLPTSGCWALTLHWSTHTAQIAVFVHPR